MIQIVTIRQQILMALQRVYDSMGFDELLSADRIEKELLAGFSPTAIATTPTDGFDEMALKLGYVKLEPGQVVVQAEDLTRIVTWFKGDARTVPHADMDTTLNRFAAALDASGVGK